MANVLVAVAETTAGAMVDNVLTVMLLFRSIVATVVVTFIVDAVFLRVGSVRRSLLSLCGINEAV